MKTITTPLLVLAMLAACGSNGRVSTPGPSGEPPARVDPTPPGEGDPSPPNKLPPAGGQRLGVVVIDVQQSFVDGAATAMAPVLTNTIAVLELAAKHQTPLLITFEATKQNGLPAEVRAAVPAHAKEFVKTTFAATGLPAFTEAVKAEALTHAVVLGAETDVCVMQTVLGLRALGLTVILQTDAAFTSEPNAGPALRRMEQSGVVLARLAEVQGWIDGSQPLPPRSDATVSIVEPASFAVVLNNLDQAALDSSPDPLKAAKLARLRELLLISEWFDLPLYGTSTALPSQLQGLLTTKQIRPLAELAEQTAVTQVALAGTDTGLDAMAADLGERTLFLVEDSLLGPQALPAIDDAVPITYKSLYYGLTKSVSLDEWPREWAERDAVYYDKTQAPEALPPIR